MTRIRIKFLEDASRLDEVATTVQAETYRLIVKRLKEQPRVKVAEILAALNIPYRCLESRLNHLQEKGLIEWGEYQIQTA